MVFMVPAVILLAITILLFLIVREPETASRDSRGGNSLRVKLLIEVLRDRGVRKTAVSYFFWKYSFEGLIYWLPTLLVETYMTDLSYAALLTGCITLTGLVSMPLGGYVSDRIRGRARVAILSLTVMGVFMLTLSTGPDFTTSLSILFTACFIMEMPESIYFTAPVDRLGPEAAGTA